MKLLRVWHYQVSAPSDLIGLHTLLGTTAKVLRPSFRVLVTLRSTSSTAETWVWFTT